MVWAFTKGLQWMMQSGVTVSVQAAQLPTGRITDIRHQQKKSIIFRRNKRGSLSID